MRRTLENGGSSLQNHPVSCDSIHEKFVKYFVVLYSDRQICVFPVEKDVQRRSILGYVRT